ncbi:MAG: polysaccharide deacetylase family protein [Bacteroidetes bacterium]|nr:polysaccharide deacetylase family protein [Bacteroidota bacterium]
MYFIKSPYILSKLTGKTVIWEMQKGKNRIFLTFDDGPIPEITPDVLKILSDYNIKATFFCVGDNIRKHPDILQQIIENGHSIGCHTFHHLNGWKTTKVEYIENVKKFEGYLQTNLFRPPYGKASPAQINLLKEKYFTILWSVLSGDFDTKITGEQCLQNVIQNTVDGSIVVFHDSIKAKERLMYALPRFIEHFLKLGYNFEAIKYEELMLYNSSLKSDL